MKTPIEPSEIREGDLIRWEGDAENATEWRARRDEARYDTSGQHYLLDRPTPPVSLPEEPTLGWLSSTGNVEVLGIWRPRHLTGGDGYETAAPGFRALTPSITAFTPATAVPTEALDKFRHLRETRNLRNGDIDAFLAAIEGANNA